MAIRINNLTAPNIIRNPQSLSFKGDNGNNFFEDNDDRQDDRLDFNAASEIQSSQNAHFIKASRKADNLNQAIIRMSKNFERMSERAKDTHEDIMLETKLTSYDIHTASEKITKTVRDVLNTYNNCKKADKDEKPGVRIYTNVIDPNTKTMNEYLDGNIKFRQTIINDTDPSDPVPIKIDETQKEGGKHNSLTLAGGVPLSYETGVEFLSNNTNDDYKADTCMTFSTFNYLCHGALSTPDTYAENISDVNGVFQADKMVAINPRENTSVIYNGFYRVDDIVLSKSTIATLNDKPVEYIEYDKYGDEKSIMSLDANAKMVSYDECKNTPDGTIYSAIGFKDDAIYYLEETADKKGKLVSSQTLTMDKDTGKIIKFSQRDKNGKTSIVVNKNIDVPA